MRAHVASVLLLLPLLAGCLDAGAPPAETDEPPDLAPTSGCPRVELVPERVTVETGELGEIRYRITNCREESVEVPRAGCKSDGIVIHIVGQGLALRIFESGSAVLGDPSHACGEEAYEPAPRTLAPGETLELPAIFTGAYMVCDPRCEGARGWAPPGEYQVAVETRGGEGDVARGVGALTLTPPVVPPYDADGPVRFVMETTYRVGETVQVRVENRGNETYSYSTYYAACSAHFFNATGYGFLIPPGTHCDIANQSPLPPATTVTLFEWDLSVCVRDNWGCSEKEPLAPGDYHVRLDLPADSGATTTAGWDFTIVP